MRYLALILIAISVFHLMSFARYNWENGNKSAAAGGLIMSLLTLFLPILTIFMVY